MLSRINLLIYIYILEVEHMFASDIYMACTQKLLKNM